MSRGSREAVITGIRSDTLHVRGIGIHDGRGFGRHGSSQLRQLLFEYFGLRGNQVLKSAAFFIALFRTGLTLLLFLFGPAFCFVVGKFTSGLAFARQLFPGHADLRFVVLQ